MADDAGAALAPLQATVADAIAKARAFTAPVASPEMRAVQCALDYLGYAYAVLDIGDANPAWAR